jgi:Flp pilus assembly protein TadG
MWHMKYNCALFSLLRRLGHDEAGYYLVSMTLLFPVLIGIVGFGTEGGLLLYNRQRLQSAADSGAYAAAIALLPINVANGQNYTRQAKAITATYGFVDGTNNVTVIANNPPQIPSPCSTSNSVYAGNPKAVEVIVTQQQAPLFSALWFSQSFNVCGRAVAILTYTAGDCLLALNSGTAISLSGNGSINMIGCRAFSNGSISMASGAGRISAGSVGMVGTATGHTSNINPSTYTQGDAVEFDPYATVNVPSSPASPCTPYSGQTTPGRYCGPITIGGNVKLSPGTYIFDSNSSNNTTLTVKNGTLTGTDVTLVFTCSTCASPSKYPSTMLDIGSNGNINLSAPATGSTAGILIFGDRTMPVGTQFSIGSNANATFNGVVYLPNGAMNWGGGGSTAATCTQIIANTFNYSGGGDLNFKGCPGNGTLVGTAVRLVD